MKKYVVFKQEEWDEWKRGNGRYQNTPDEVEDAVVMRRQDVFAAPAFRVYANSMAASMVVAAKLVAPGLHLESETISKIARYFQEQAELSESEDRKVPD